MSVSVLLNLLATYNLDLFSEFKPSDDELDPMDPAAYSDTPRSVSHTHTHTHTHTL